MAEVESLWVEERDRKGERPREGERRCGGYVEDMAEEGVGESE